VARTGNRNENVISIGKPDGKRSLRKPWRRWENNINMVLLKVLEGVDWIHLA
jgi:hypothetical protein